MRKTTSLHADTDMTREDKLNRLSIPSIIRQSAKEWRLPLWQIFALILLPFAILTSGVALALISKDAYKLFTREDGIAETIQAVAYVVALVLSVIMTVRLFKRKENLPALLYVGLCLGLLFMAGEELNWGQRAFGWHTPDTYAEINKQAETNLHNIYGVGSTFKWLQMVVGAYGTFLPILFFWTPLLDKYRQLFKYITPHYVLIPYFVFLFGWRLFRNLFEVPRRYYFAVAEFNEVLELILALGILLFLLHTLTLGLHHGHKSNLGPRGGRTTQHI